MNFFGHGTLFADIELFLGAGAAWLTLDMSAFFDGVPIALMPCGAFFALAVVVASLTALERPGDSLRVQTRLCCSTTHAAKKPGCARPKNQSDLCPLADAQS